MKQKSLSKLFSNGVELILYGIVFVIFYITFAHFMPQLLVLNRTVLITVSSYVIIFALMLRLYGRCDIDKRYGRNIMLSMSLVILFTDIVAFVQLTIMNVNVYTNYQIQWRYFNVLVVVYFVQLMACYVLTLLGAKLYKYIKSVRNVVIVYKEELGLDDFVHHIEVKEKFNRVDHRFHVKDNLLWNHLENADEIILYNVHADDRAAIIEYCYKHNLSISYTPDYVDVMAGKNQIAVMSDYLLITNETVEIGMMTKILKRSGDIVLSLIAIVLLIPLWLVIALFIKVEDGGRIFYIQKRVTQYGREFQLLKIRSMKEDSGHRLAKKNDVRITRVGQIIRRFRLDETPQFLNILKGDMSIVGPRPESKYYTDKFTEEMPEFEHRLKVKAGLTGYAQIFGRYNTSPQKKLLFDLYYINNLSILFDLKIMMQTPYAVLKPDSSEGV